MGHSEYLSELSSSTSQPLIKKMIPQLLLSVSLFSFVFSYSSLIYSPSSSSSSSLVYSPKFNLFSAKYFHLLSRVMNKNCLFLICNGLLVFLAKTSGLVRAPSESDDMLHKKIGLELLKETLLHKYVSEEIINDDDGQKEKEEVKDDEEEDKSGLSSPKEVSIFVAESEEEDEGACDLEDRVEKDENGADHNSRICWLFDDDEDEDEEEEEEEDGDEKMELSTEELNQKFEEFIRRMKNEIRITATKQKALMLSSSTN